MYSIPGWERWTVWQGFDRTVRVSYNKCTASLAGIGGLSGKVLIGLSGLAITHAQTNEIK